MAHALGGLGDDVGDGADTFVLTYRLNFAVAWRQISSGPA